MDECVKETDTATNAPAGGNLDTVTVTDGEAQSSKRVVKLSVKALAARLERLQNGRKAKLNKAGNVKKTIQGLMQSGKHADVQNALDGYIELRDEARWMHDSIMILLPESEKEKHETWFKAKIMFIDEFIENTQRWVSENESVVDNEGKLEGGDENDDENVENPEDNINPDDSVSNTGKRSKASKISTTSSAQIKAEAERAALVARMTALKEQHALEEQEQQIRRRKEQLKLETELAASTAKLAVLQASDGRSSHAGDGMNSYLERERRKLKPLCTLNPTAKEYEPVGWKQQQKDWSLPQYKQSAKDTKPKQTQMQISSATKQDADAYYQQHGKTSQCVQAGTTSWENKQHVHLQSDGITSGNVVAIMHKQNEITAALVHQQHLLSLPTRDIPTFEGDPLQYKAFIKAFENGVEDKASAADCLYYLEQFTRGQPKELVRSCQHMSPERGYIVAKELLQENFGNDYKISAAYTEKALAWPGIKSEDVKALQAYALFLRGCCNVMGELHYMQELDLPANID